MRRRSNVIALAAIFFGLGIFITFLFPSCVVIVLTSLAVIIVGCIALKC